MLSSAVCLSHKIHQPAAQIEPTSTASVTQKEISRQAQSCLLATNTNIIANTTAVHIMNINCSRSNISWNQAAPDVEGTAEAKEDEAAACNMSYITLWMAVMLALEEEYAPKTKHEKCAPLAQG
jgi:hypothetical protein